jgi:hypothetical protein
MKSSIRRFSFFAVAVAVGASVFGLFWSATVQAYVAGGPYCSGVTASGPNKTMCYKGSTVLNCTPTMQSTYLKTSGTLCTACPTSPN